MRTRWIVVPVVLACVGALGLHEMQRARAASPATGASAAESASALDVSPGSPTEAPSPAAEPSLAVADTTSPATAHVPYQAPPVEPEEVLESMSREEIEDEVAQIHDQLKRRNAIERLNKDGAVSADERAELGAMIYHAGYLKASLAKRGLGEIEKRIADYRRNREALFAANAKKER
jgi:hypothetical protein